MQSDSSMVMRTGTPLSTWFCSMRTSSTSHMYESDGDITILVCTLKYYLADFRKWFYSQKNTRAKNLKYASFHGGGGF